MDNLIRKKLQDLIAHRGQGLCLEPDRCKAGEWDRVTERATREFQRDHFLKPSGQLDRDTLAVLSSHASRSTR